MELIRSLKAIGLLLRGVTLRTGVVEVPVVIVGAGGATTVPGVASSCIFLASHALYTAVARSAAGWVAIPLSIPVFVAAAGWPVGIMPPSFAAVNELSHPSIFVT